MNVIPVLKGSRLTLRGITAEDHSDLLAMSHDLEVTRFLNEGKPPSPEEVWQRMAMALGQWSLRGYGMMAVDDDDGFVGRAGVYHPFGEVDPQLSYIIARRGWGRGYATEVGEVLLDWLSDVHKPRRIISHIHPENVASARVATKLGAERSHTCMSGAVRMDVWVYAAR